MWWSGLIEKFGEVNELGEFLNLFARCDLEGMCWVGYVKWHISVFNLSYSDYLALSVLSMKINGNYIKTTKRGSN